MCKIEKKWNIKLYGDNLSTNAIINNILVNRGIDDQEHFLNPTCQDLIPFSEMSNIVWAKDIILDTIKQNKTFLIYADVDLDGCCSTAIAYRYLKNYTDNVITYINSGKAHGVVDDFDMNTLLTVDTVIVVDSINDTSKMYKKIIELGKQLVIIDHHVPTQEILDNNFCLVSSAVNYRNPYLSGSGMTWKVMKYIDSVTDNNYADLLSDLAAAGIIGDVCEVGQKSPENRYICFVGLNNLTNPALTAILGNYEFNSTSISYSIAPLTNAANRLCYNKVAMNLFLSDDSIEIGEMIETLKQCRETQKTEVKRLYEEIIIPQSKTQLSNKCLYFMNSGESAFNGVVAGKAANDFCRPVMVLTESKDNKLFRGSMRAVGVEDFRKIINDSQYAHCMGHEQSAGVDIPIDDFFLVYNYIETQLKDYDFKQELTIDVCLSPCNISNSLITKLKQINKISGRGFRPITVAVEDIVDYTVSKMSNGKHMSIKTDKNLSLIKWNISENEDVKQGQNISAVGTLDLNTFYGKTSRQLIILDYKIK